MNTSFMRLGILGLLLALVGLLGALHLRRRQGELRQLETTVRDELAANRRERQALRVAQAKAAALAPAAAAPSKHVAAKEAPPATNLAIGSRLAEEVRSRPEYAPFHQRSLRRSILRTYGELFAELKLSPEREEALKKILEDRHDRGMKLILETHRKGQNQVSPEYHKAGVEQQAAAQAAIDAILNADEKTIYQRFEKSRVWRTTQQPEFDEFVADRGLPPLAAAQKQALAAAFAQSRDWKPDQPEEKLNRVEIHRLRSEQMMKLAAAALEPKQRAVLADYLNFNDSRGEIMGRLFYPEKPAGSVFMTVAQQRP